MSMVSKALKSRTVAGVVTAIETLEGAGFLVRRPFPTASFSDFDPFLLLDEMGRWMSEPDRLRARRIIRTVASKL